MNLFSISTLILCLSSIVFSLIIYRTDRANSISKAWFYSCITFSLWALGLSGVTLSSSASTAFMWQFLLDVSAIFLPYLYINFVFNLLGFRETIARNILFVCAVVFSVFSFSPLFKIGMMSVYGFHWINPGPYYYLFLVYFIFYAVLSLGLLVYGYYKAEKGSILRSQMRNTILGAIMGFGGGVTNFFPQLFSIYPYGNYLVILYIVFMVYGVLRYRMMNAKVISAQIFSTTLILISLFSLLKTDNTSDWLLNFFILIMVLIFSFFLIKSVNREVALRISNENLAAERQAAIDRQKDLIYIMNHQIKGKLGDAKNVLAELLTDAYGVVPDSARPWIERGLEAAKAGVDFVQSILKGSSAENGTLQFTMAEFDLKTMVKDVAEKKRAKATTKGLVYEVNLADGEFMVNGDMMLLNEAVGNLITNSIAFTPSGSIHIWLTRKGGRALIAVQDTGVGISAEDRPKLWKSGGRGKDSLKVNVESTGYGLAFVRGVVIKHGGRAWEESDGPGKGSSFYMELPLVG